jgi:hypothetical protein
VGGVPTRGVVGGFFVSKRSVVFHRIKHIIPISNTNPPKDKPIIITVFFLELLSLFVRDGIFL